MLTSVQTTEDRELLLEDLRERVTGESAFPISVEGGSLDENREVGAAIRERMFAEIGERCRATFAASYEEFRRMRRVRVQTPRQAPSVRLAGIIEAETQRVLGPSTPANRTLSDTSIEVENASTLVRLRNPQGIAARTGDCTYEDPGGDDLNDWGADMAGFVAQYGRAIPWKPGWQTPPPDPITGPQSSWKIAVYLDNAPFNIARLDVLDGTPYSLAANEFVLGLANATSWAKRASYWQSCLGQIVSVEQPGQNFIPDEKRIFIDMPPYPPSPIPSIVFRKPGFLGRWHDVGHFNLFESRFADFFGQTHSVFTWVVD